MSEFDDFFQRLQEFDFVFISDFVSNMTERELALFFVYENNEMVLSDNWPILKDYYEVISSPFWKGLEINSKILYIKLYRMLPMIHLVGKLVENSVMEIQKIPSLAPWDRELTELIEKKKINEINEALKNKSKDEKLKYLNRVKEDLSFEFKEEEWFVKVNSYIEKEIRITQNEVETEIEIPFKISLSRERQEYVFKGLKEYVDEKDYPNLLKILDDQVCSGKVSFLENGNIFLDLIRRLYYGKWIPQNQPRLNKWIIDNFVFFKTTEKRLVNFKEDTIKDCFKSKFTCKRNQVAVEGLPLIININK